MVHLVSPLNLVAAKENLPSRTPVGEGGIADLEMNFWDV
jgi:hypothetical protein